MGVMHLGQELNSVIMPVSNDEIETLQIGLKRNENMCVVKTFCYIYLGALHRGNASPGQIMVSLYRQNRWIVNY